MFCNIYKWTTPWYTTFPELSRDYSPFKNVLVTKLKSTLTSPQNSSPMNLF